MPTRLFTLPLTLLLPTLSLAAPCPTAVPVSDLRDALGTAEAAFSSQDVDGLNAAVTTARDALPCVDGPLTTDDAAHVHRVEALSDFLARDLDGTEQHYRAVLRLKPDYALPGGIAPPGGPLRTRFEAATEAGPPDMRDVPAPAEGAVLIDGAQVPTAPADLPFVLQQLDGDGGVSLSVLLDPGAELPEYETKRDLALAAKQAAAASPGTPAPPPAPEASGKTRRILMFVGAGLAVAGGGALAGLAASEKSAYEDVRDNTPYTPDRAETLDGHITRNHGYLRGAVALGVVGLGLGVGGAF